MVYNLGQDLVRTCKLVSVFSCSL